MITSNISVNRACPVYTFKTKKNNQQTSFKGNISEKQNQGMTQEQETWLAVGLAVLVSLAIGVIAWACSKKEALNANKTSKPVDKATVKIKKQFKELDDKMQKHFVKIKLEEYNPKWDMVKTMPNMQITSLESKNDFSLYEQMVLVPQLLGRNQQLYENKRLIDHDIQEAYEYANKNAKIKETFVEYLKLRSEYFDKDNDFDVVRSEVLKNPSDDVVDVETLRLSILANNTRQFLYSDESVEEPHNMIFFVNPLLIANYTAKMLSEFQPQRPYSETSRAEDEYFEEMRDFGKDWHNKTKDWYKGSINWMKRLVTGEEYQSAQSGYSYFPHLFGTGVDSYINPRLLTVPDKTKLSDILSSGAKSKWDEVMKKNEVIEYIGREITLPSLRDNIIRLEDRFMELQHAVDYKNYSRQDSLKSEISKLIPEVLI